MIGNPHNRTDADRTMEHRARVEEQPPLEEPGRIVAETCRVDGGWKWRVQLYRPADDLHRAPGITRLAGDARDRFVAEDAARTWGDRYRDRQTPNTPWRDIEDYDDDEDTYLVTDAQTWQTT